MLSDAKVLDVVMLSGAKGFRRGYVIRRQRFYTSLCYQVPKVLDVVMLSGAKGFRRGYVIRRQSFRRGYVFRRQRF